MKAVYKIINGINGKCYVGSSKNVRRRWVTHRSMLRNNSHHCLYLQRSVNTYGLGNFVLEILEEVDSVDSLFEREQFWINAISPSYNLGSVGGGDNTSNHPRNAEIRLKISKANIGRPSTPMPGSTNPNWKGGKGKCKTCGVEVPRSNKSGFCKKHYPKSGSGNPFYGKHHTPETKATIAKANIGRLPSNCRKVSILGKEFISLSSASRAVGISPPLMMYRIKSSKYPEYLYVL